MSEDWRVVREFPNYVIAPNGTVMSYKTGKVIRPRTVGGRYTVRLFKNGVQYERAVRRLVDTAFPRVPVAEVLDEWRVIPGFETYEINRYGRVRKRSSHRELAIRLTSGRHVVLFRDGKPHKRSISGLLELVFQR